MSAATDWALLEDYCAATGTTPSTVDAGVVSRFVAFTMGRSVTRPRRVRALLRQLVQVGAPVELPDPPPLEPWWKPDGLPLGEVLARIDPTGWPGGFRRCRDGFILTVAAAGLSRRAVRGLSAADLHVRIGTVTVTGCDVPEAETPAECGRCAMTRWLRVLAAFTAGGRADVQPLVAAPGLLRWHRHNHDCRTPLPTSWGEAWALLPAVDVHGWPDDSQPVSLRTLTAVMSYWRSSRPPQLIVPDEPVEHVDAAESPYAELGWDELDEVVDRVCAEADEVLARVSQFDWDTSRFQRESL